MLKSFYFLLITKRSQYELENPSSFHPPFLGLFPAALQPEIPAILGPLQTFHII